MSKPEAKLIVKRYANLLKRVILCLLKYICLVLMPQAKQQKIVILM